MSRLGEDEHGVWLGAPPRTTIWRPGATFRSSTEWVTCFARAARWTASFYPREEHDIAVYVDITTPPSWSHDDARGLHTVAMDDLDLDVMLCVNGELLIDDEDEFEEHQHSLGYPADVVTMAQSTAAAVFAAIGADDEPFHSVGQAWLAGYAGALRTGR